MVRRFKAATLLLLITGCSGVAMEMAVGLLGRGLLPRFRVLGLVCRQEPSCKGRRALDLLCRRQSGLLSARMVQ